LAWFGVREAQSGDDTVAAAFGWAERNEQDLIFVVVDDQAERLFETEGEGGQGAVFTQEAPWPAAGPTVPGHAGNR
jgi:hypothetical protein